MPRDIEADRLAARIELDLLLACSDERFAGITRTAQRLFGVSMAAFIITGVDRLCCKSVAGHPFIELERIEAFCRRVLAVDGPFVVRAVRADPDRVDATAGPEESGLGFFAGLPLKSRNGQRIAVLALLDPVARSWTAEDRIAFEDLAGWAQTKLDRGIPEAQAAMDPVLLQALLEAQETLEIGRVVVDEARILEASKTFCRLSGYTSEELLELPGGLGGLVSPGSGASLAEILAFRTSYGSLSVPFFDATLESRDGRRIDIDIGIHSFGLPERPYFMCFVRDTSKRNLDLQAIRESEDRYRQLVEHSPNLISIHCDGRVAYVNTSGMKLLGAHRSQELIGRPVLEFVAPEFREQIAARMRGSLVDGKVSPLMEERFIRLDGTLVDVEVTGAPILYRGRPAVQIIARDISDRKRIAERLIRSERLLANAERLAGLGSWEIGLPAFELSWSEQLFRLCGLEPRDRAPDLATIAGLLHPEDRSRVMSLARQIGSRREPFGIAFRIVRADGEIRHLASKAEYVLDAAGECLKVIGVSLDLTERAGPAA